MKCALELQAISTAQAEINKAYGEFVTEQERIKTRERTIRCCEKLGKEIELRAKKGEAPRTSFHFDFLYKNEFLGNILEETTDDYADGRLSYNTIPGRIDLRVMEEWFDRYCFKVTRHETWVWRYGYGQMKAFWVTISPAKKCG